MSYRQQLFLFEAVNMLVSAVELGFFCMETLLKGRPQVAIQ